MKTVCMKGKKNPTQPAAKHALQERSTGLGAAQYKEGKAER